MIKVKNICVVICMGIFLSGCSWLNNISPELITTTKVVETYPSLPDINIPEANLKAWTHDVPRNLDGDMIIKNVSYCKGIKEEDQDVNFWAKCGEYPITLNSNIYIGFDQDNWNIILQNFYELKAVDAKKTAIIKQINEQRKIWREKNNNQ